MISVFLNVILGCVHIWDPLCMFLLDICLSCHRLQDVSAAIFMRTRPADTHMHRGELIDALHYNPLTAEHFD